MKVVRTALALLALLAAVVGVPPLLVIIGRLPDPRSWSGRSLSEILLGPDDGSLLLGLLSVAAWVVWALFTISVVVEVVNLRRERPIRIPGLGGLQGLAAVLVIAAVATLAAPRAAPVAELDATSYPLVRAASVSAGAGPLATPASDQAPSERSPGILAVHTVTSGESLWALAERYYDDGGQWRQIALANPILQRLGPDALEVGWELIVPRQGAVVGPHVVVRAGDTLGSLAHDHLGETDRWPELYEANRSILTDPDEVAEGTILRLPERTGGHPRADADQSRDDQSRDDQSRDDQSRDDQSRSDRDREKDRPGQDRRDADGTPTEPVPPTRPATPAPTEAIPTEPTERQGAERPGSEVVAGEVDPEPALLAAGFSGMAAAAVVGALAVRRAVQLHQRPVGRRISHPGPAGIALEGALGRQQTPEALRAVERAMRRIATHCRTEGIPVPRLTHILVDAERCEFHLVETPPAEPPTPFRSAGPIWMIDDLPSWLAEQDAGPSELEGSAEPEAGGAVYPWPATVGFGMSGQSHLLVNLEEHGIISCRAEGPEPDDSDDEDRMAFLGAVVCELAFHPWSQGVRITVLTEPDAVPWLVGLDLPELHVTDDPADVLGRLERVAEQRRAHRERAGGVETWRLDSTLAEAWAPEVLLVADRMTEQDRATLQQMMGEGRAGQAALVLESSVVSPTAPMTVTVGGQGRARITPGDLEVRFHRIGAVVASQLCDVLVGTSGPTTAAPWWAAREGPRRASDRTDDTPTASILGLPPARARPEASGTTDGGATAEVLGNDDGTGQNADTAVDNQEVAVMVEPTSPTLLMLGPIDLLGTRGTPPVRARMQCIEYAAWLLEHPDSTAMAMAAGLVVAEGTRRSNMSRLRSWLGAGDEGPYLPDAYSGRINLSEEVTSDWDQVQLLVHGGVNRVGDDALVDVLELVRGAPLADAAPGQWHWAEEMRTDMASVVRDVGVELAARSLARGDTDLARWAANRALAAAPGDELLVGARIRVEHHLGRSDEVDRLARQLVRQSRRLGVDLMPGTVELLQTVIEGRVRSRTGPEH